ncbi:uncharacterized protein J3R85_019279 [Psidium guajava]|nr:uncharacterized protein J3R85_019279 [Psidium guajava]
MASPPPSSDPKTAAIGYPIPSGVDIGRANTHPTSLVCMPPGSNPQPVCSRCGITGDWTSDLWPMCVAITAVLTFSIVVMASAIFLRVLAGPEYPKLKVAGLTVTNLTVVASTRASWNAALLAEKPEFFGNLLFREVECSLYYRGDEVRPLALSTADRFVLQSTDRYVIKAKIKMERPAEAVVEDMGREWRSVRTVTVGLGLRMHGTYVLGSWWKKDYGYIEAFCNNLTVAFANYAVEGSLVTSNNLVTDDNLPSDNLPPCSYKGVEPDL